MVPFEINPEKGRLCLSMIVKNESKIIERLIRSVLPIIDTYCICDTGSTDNTIEIIERCFKETGKPGEVIQEPFKNFGYNRTHALKAAEKWGEYALLLDADMILNIGNRFTKEALVGSAYQIKQSSASLDYYNTRIVKTGIGIKCIGPTHEYYDIPGGDNQRLDTLWITDIGDGGAKADKFERDIRLLTDGLKEEPTNGRYHFYLANSYRDLGNYTEAIAWYKKRVLLGGWNEEIFYAKYEIGNCYSQQKEYEHAIYWWLDAYNERPSRAESLYEIVKQYRIQGKYTLAQKFLDIAKLIPYPSKDILFIKKRVYDYDLDFEQSILAFYTGHSIDPKRYLELIGKGYHRDTLMLNYRFYAKKLSAFGGVDYIFTDSQIVRVRDLDEPMYSSTPSIVPDGDGYILNVRYVNYKLRMSGVYEFTHSDGKIISLNRVYKLSHDLSIKESHMIDHVENASLRYVGIEDVKLFRHNEDILLLGTVQHPTTGCITMGKGIYSMTDTMLRFTAFDSPNGRGCEKNWCYLHTRKNALRIVYEWYPLTLYTEDLSCVSKDTDVPDFFRYMCGSTNGHRIDNEIWFLCHIVDYSTPRYYYHIFVILDANTLKYKRHSSMFKFHKDPIEFALGLIVEKERILISYSRMDASSIIHVVPRSIVETELF